MRSVDACARASRLTLHLAVGDMIARDSFGRNILFFYSKSREIFHFSTSSTGTGPPISSRRSRIHPGRWGRSPSWYGTPGTPEPGTYPTISARERSRGNGAYLTPPRVSSNYSTADGAGTTPSTGALATVSSTPNPGGP